MTRLIHETAIIESGAKLGHNVEVGPYAIIHRNVVIEDDCKIGSYCELGIETSLGDGSPLIIAKNSNIRSRSTFYESSSFGENLVTGHSVIVRENTKAGKSLQIGSMSDIQGDCSFGDHTRMQSNVFVGKMSQIGSFVWLFPYVILTNDPTPPSNDLIGVTIEDFAAIAAASVILPGVKVGAHSLVAAHACVTKDVPSGAVVGGTPAKIIAETKDIHLRNDPSQSAYPWTQHFHRGYPNDIVEAWKNQFIK